MLVVFVAVVADVLAVVADDASDVVAGADVMPMVADDAGDVVTGAAAVPAGLVPAVPAAVRRHGR